MHLQYSNPSFLDYYAHSDHCAGMTIRDSFATRLREIRKDRGLSQEKLAALCDRSIEAISNLERGKNLPSFETLEKLTEALNIPARDFFDYDDDDPERSGLLASLFDAARSLDTSDLKLAVNQVRAIRDSRN